MQNTRTKSWMEGAAASFILALATLNTGVASADTTATEQNPALDRAVMATLEQCHQVSSSCADTTKGALGVLVFPKVIKADLIIGGAGGKGALIENGHITGYYNIGAGSAGLQAGIDKTSQVYVFRSSEALAKLKEGPDWKVGATADVTLIKADANASAATGDVLAYVFDGRGLNAGIALDVFDVWQSGQERPSES